MSLLSRGGVLTGGCTGNPRRTNMFARTRPGQFLDGRWCGGGGRRSASAGQTGSGRHRWARDRLTRDRIVTGLYRTALTHELARLRRP
jgi:hypothetical protein